MKQISTHTFTGLQRDLAISKCSSQTLLDAHNIRITAREGETLLSVTNEKGPKELKLINEIGAAMSLTGTIIGHCVLNNYLVLFTHDDSTGDNILRIDMNRDNPTAISLVELPNRFSLNFSANNPIEAIGDYENESIQKVYWTDGLNQPRVINIANNPSTGSPKIHRWVGDLDFTPELALNETVTVTRDTSSSGMFPAGVIQYAFTYYNKYGQETNIFHTTPLYYISFYDRGGSPESRISNSFRITVEGVDKHFDYLRIYSIMRTSIDATPVAKRLQDIALDSIGTSATYIDTGTNGEDVDPTSLLYLGGEHIVAETLCSKDGTLFLGGIKIDRPVIPNSIKSALKEDNPAFTTASQLVTESLVSRDCPYPYSNGLNSQSAGFKNREYYRLGVQFQYKNGKWSEPCWIGDYKVEGNEGPMREPGNPQNLYKLVIKYNIAPSILIELSNLGYKKHRPLVVFPDEQDRTIIAQGVVNPTMRTYNQTNVNKDLQGQSSWFFRPIMGATSIMVDAKKAVAPSFENNSVLPYICGGIIEDDKDSDYYRRIEIQGNFNTGKITSTAPNKFEINWGMLTFHSPEIEFNDSIHSMDLSGIRCKEVGYAVVKYVASDIDIQTKTPTISSSGSGFVHKSFVSNGPYGIVSGLFYDDYLVDDDSKGNFRSYSYQHNPVKWLIYPWQQSGSLNNDCNRPTDKGVRSAELLKKVISNMRYTDTTWKSKFGVEQSLELLGFSNREVPQLFSSDQVSIIKVADKVYQGNVDTVLSPAESDGNYFAFDKWNSISNQGTDKIDTQSTITTDFTSTAWWKTYTAEGSNSGKVVGLYKRTQKTAGVNFAWSRANSHIGDTFMELAIRKDSIRMKYKSTPHIVLTTSFSDTLFNHRESGENYLPIVELYNYYSPVTAFGGKTQDALRANLWLPAGKASNINISEITYEYGDTWYSRYDCLKTYPFTSEDPNQIVEIGSFMLETHINIDGRYDRNRGQINNLNMTPRNFNLYNPVYSQKDNFFSYRILDNDYYELNDFPNQITWSTEKTAGVDVDPWTSVTLASTYDMDGSRGKIRAMTVWNDNIYCFQDNGVSNILFNSRVQIPTSDNAPIEITNSYKVDGKRYISDGIGCANKYSVCCTPSGVYFIDAVSKHLYNIGGNGIMDVSTTKNMTSWFKGIDSSKWTGNKYGAKLFHDSCHNDLYIVTEDECLCFNEIIGEFTSYMSYHDVPVMYNVLDKFYCINNNYVNEMFAGDYGYFFGQYEPYDFTFVVNGIDQKMVNIDKTFTNIELFADRWSDNFDSVLSPESPFDYIRLWNEYQDTGEVLLKDIKDRPSNLKKKFRTWRVLVPRDAHNRRDRIRNTWCKVKIGSAPRYRNGNDGVVELHNLNVVYYV